MHILHILKHDIFKSTIPSYEYCYTQQYAYNSTTHDGFKEFYAQMMFLFFSTRVVYVNLLILSLFKGKQIARNIVYMCLKINNQSTKRVNHSIFPFLGIRKLSITHKFYVKCDFNHVLTILVKSPKLKNLQIFNVIKVLRYINIVVH